MKYLVAIFVICALVVGTWLGSFLLFPSSTSNEEVVFEVSPGSSLWGVAKHLEDEGLVSDSFRLKVFARLLGYDKKIRTGEYLLKKDMKPLGILQILSSGKSIEYSFTVPEGWNMYEIAEQFEQKGFGTQSEFLALCRDKAFIKSLLGEELYTLEGYLYPDTYKLTKYTKARELIRNMVDHFLINYEKVKSENTFGYSRHEAVILASMVEKESGSPKDRPYVSSVFHNRLKKGMQLQSDPTIIYGILDQTGTLIKNIRKKDIRGPTKYNTYTVKRLPYGPIANPGIDAFRATFNPVQSSLLYFVSRNDGTTAFSETLKEHNANVRKYQLNSINREGKSWRDLNDKDQDSKSL